MKAIGLAMALAAASGAPRVAHAQATIAGLVYDSLARAPLSDAVVQVVRVDSTRAPQTHSATTDALGRYSIPGVQPGRYMVGFYHPVLDSLGLELRPRAIDVGAAGVVQQDLSVPGAAAIAVAFCGADAASDSSGTVLGRVYDAETLIPATGATVVASWTALVVDPRELRTERRQVSAKVSPDGGFAFCNVPAPGSIVLQADRGSDSTGAVEVPLPARGVVRRDLYLGRVASTTMRVDSVKVGDSVQALSRPMRHGAGRLSGMVRTKQGRPIKGARVHIAGSGIEAQTDEQGRFLLVGAPTGTQRVELRALGYYPEERVVDLVAGRAASLEVTLATLRSVLDTVRVFASRIYSRDSHGFERRRRAGWGRYFDQNDVQRLRPFGVTELLHRVPGVRIWHGMLDRFVVMRRLGTYCQPTIFIDGIRRTGLDARDIDHWVRPEELAGVEVYTSGIFTPAEFTVPGQSCGSIVLWTRPPPPRRK